MPSRIQRSAYPNAVTGANITVGFLSMLESARGSYDTAVYLLLIAIFLDMGDGRLARRLRATSEMGKQLDSLCDVISFGAAPAFLIYHAELQVLGAAGVAVALLYLLAGTYRLARFNLLADAHAKQSRTVGMPIPIGAGYLMAAALMRDQIPPLADVVLVVVVALLMVSRLSLPDLKGKSLVSSMLVVGLGNYLAVIAWPNWWTVAWWNLWNVAILVAARSEERRPASDFAPSR